MLAARQNSSQLKTDYKIIKHSLLICLLFLVIGVKAQSDHYKWSFKFGGSTYSNIINSGTTYDWYGNSRGPEIFAGIGFKNIHFSTSYRYFEEEIKENLPYTETYYLPKGASVRMVFWNLSLSYEKEIIRRFFIEPSIGYLQNNTTSNIFDLQGNEFDIKDLNGLTIGLNLIKYIKFQDGLFLGIYASCNYNFVNYQSLNSNLENNALGYSIGIILKGTNRKK